MKYCIDENTMISIADAIRRKNPRYQENMLPSTMVTAIDDIETGGGGGDLDWSKLAAGLLPEAGADISLSMAGPEYEGCNSIRPYLFAASDLKSLTVDESIDRVGIAVCEGCTSLEEVHLPWVTALDERAFNGCYNLTTVDIPNLESVGYNCLQGVPFNGDVVFDSLKYTSIYDQGSFSLGAGTLDNMTSFRGGSMPAVGQQFFQDRARLQTVDLPECTQVGDNAFDGCSSLQGFDFGKIAWLGDGAFQNCTSLPSELHFPALTHIGGYVFYGCSQIQKLYFQQRWDEVPWTDPFSEMEGLTDVYVPWSEGELEGAPWGADSATIHYDTQYDDDGNVIS